MVLAEGTHEVWMPIPGVRGYSASNLGRIRNDVTQHIKKPVLHSAGYFKVVVNSRSEPKTIVVHRAVASAFFGDIQGKQVNHINCDKSDNRLANLELCTASQNTQHAVKMGRLGREGGWVMRPDETVQFAVALFLCGCSVRQAAKLAGVERSQVVGWTAGRCRREETSEFASRIDVVAYGEYSDGSPEDAARRLIADVFK